jgi:hypothetical protein
MGKKWLILGIVLVIIIAGLGIIFFASGKVSDKNSKSDSDNGQVAGASTQNENAAYKENLAKFLKEKGMILYGAYWCPHCKEQKELFGDAVQYLDYVECDAKGPNANPDECVARGIQGYPTWIYEGKQYSGTQSLAELAKIVGFKE